MLTIIHGLLAFGPEWLWHPLGQCTAASTNHVIAAHEITRCKSYNFHSGIAANFGELALLGSAVSLFVLAWHYVNCNSPGCYRVSKHHYVDKQGKRHALCHVHDVDDHPKGGHWWSWRQHCDLAEIHRRIKQSRETPKLATVDKPKRTGRSVE